MERGAFTWIRAPSEQTPLLFSSISQTAPDSRHLTPWTELHRGARNRWTSYLVDAITHDERRGLGSERRENATMRIPVVGNCRSGRLTRSQLFQEQEQRQHFSSPSRNRALLSKLQVLNAGSCSLAWVERRLVVAQAWAEPSHGFMARYDAGILIHHLQSTYQDKFSQAPTRVLIIAYCACELLLVSVRKSGQSLRLTKI